MLNKKWLYSSAFSVITALLLTACSPGRLFGPTTTPTSTITPIPTATLTPTLTPSLTPTPTPMGGSGKLLLHLRAFTWNVFQGVYLYDLHTTQLSIFLEMNMYGAVQLYPIDPRRAVLFEFAGDHIDLSLYEFDNEEKTILHNNIRTGGDMWSGGWLQEVDMFTFLAYGDNGKIQVFLIHPDGTGLRQLTNSDFGAGAILPRFDGGIYWEEAAVQGGGYSTKGWRWTSLDGSETHELDAEPAPHNEMPEMASPPILQMPGGGTTDYNFFLWKHGNWSPDGKLYVYTQIRNCNLANRCEYYLLLFNNETQEAQELFLNLPENTYAEYVDWFR